MSRFKFSVGPWNVHSGADAYGPATRDEISFEEKVKKFAELGFSAIQFHDDDAVPNMNALSHDEIKAEPRKVKTILNKNGMLLQFYICLHNNNYREQNQSKKNKSIYNSK